jgi:TonB family protein
MKALLFAIAVAGQAAQPPAEPYRLGPGVTAPKLIHDEKPQYTSDAMRRGIQGVVMIECVVEIDGTPSNIRVTQSLDPDLDQQAIKAMRGWRFTPGTKDGQPVRVAVHTELTFTLGRRPAPAAPGAIVISSRMEPDGSSSIFEIVEDRFRGLPSWNPASNPQPPLSSAEALAIAQERLRTTKPRADASAYVLLNENLARIGGRTSDRWSYQLTFAPITAKDASAGSPVTIVVLFDRTTIEPRVEKLQK